MRLRRQRLMRASAAIVLLGLLAGCAAGVPQVDPGQTPAKPLPVVDSDQASRILSSVSDTVSAADTARSADQLAGRVMDPAKQIRAAQYQIANATNDPTKISPLGFDPELEIITATDSWPRFFFVSAKMVGSADNQVYPFLVFVQNSPRDQYQLWGWARRLPNQQLPTMALATDGAVPLASDASGLAMTPQQAVAAYADVRNNGSASASANAFAPDPLTQALADATAQVQSALASSATYSMQTTPVDGQIYSAQTADGGALIATQYDRQLDIGVKSGQSVQIPQDVAALTGVSNAQNSVTAHYTDIVVMYVPPAGSTDQISILCADDSLVSAQAS